MENASKALIIAGAILVSILIISIGVIIVNLINPVTDEVGGIATSSAVQTFNSRFTNYEGTGKRAAEVRSLVNLVKSTGAQERTVGLVWGNASDGKVLSAAKLNPRGTYTIEFEYDNNGYIEDAYIYEDGKTKPTKPTS